MYARAKRNYTHFVNYRVPIKMNDLSRAVSGSTETVSGILLQ